MITEKEFTEIYNKNASKVYRLCLGYSAGDVNRAKEWAQEVFIKVWNHRNSFKGMSTIETWVYRITVNVCLGHLRKPNNNIPINEEILSSNQTEASNNSQASDIKQLYECIDKLNAQNKALILLELEDIPQASIAESLGLSHGSIRTRLNRIRKSLLKCMNNEG